MEIKNNNKLIEFIYAAKKIKAYINIVSYKNKFNDNNNNMIIFIFFIIKLSFYF